MRMRRTGTILGVLLLLGSIASRPEPGPAGAHPALPTASLAIGSLTLTVEVAATPAARSRGLMFRRALLLDRGMLFVFPASTVMSFWMRNTRIPLSIAFIDEEGRIAAIKPLAPFDERPVSSGVPARYALEVNRGVFERHGIAVGAPVTGLSTIPAATH